MRYAVKTAATEEPVGITELKDQCRVTHNADNEWLVNAETAVREFCADLLRRTFCTTTLYGYADEFPYGREPIYVERPPLVSVTSIVYTAADGTSTTILPANLIVDAVSEPGRILPAYGSVWPLARDIPNAVRVEFVAGYGAATAVPQKIRNAIKLAVERLYDRRDDGMDIEAALGKAGMALLLSERWGSL